MSITSGQLKQINQITQNTESLIRDIVGDGFEVKVSFLPKRHKIESKKDIESLMKQYCRLRQFQYDSFFKKGGSQIYVKRRTFFIKILVDADWIWEDISNFFRLHKETVRDAMRKFNDLYEVDNSYKIDFDRFNITIEKLMSGEIKI